MPSSVTPSPKCANAVPQAERGKPRARANAVASGTLQQTRALDDIGHRARHDKERKPDRERRQHRPPPSMAKITATAIAPIGGGADEPLRDAEQIAALPGQQRPERHRDQQRNEQRPEGRVEERRADRNLLAGQRLERERIERADEHRRAGASPGTDC